MTIHNPRSVEQLDLASLSPGTIHRLQINLATDALHQPLSVPVVVARGKFPGPTLCLSAAVHGNELNGIPVIHSIIEHIDCKRLHGTIVGILVVNVPGFLAHERSFERWDLNHHFPGEPKGNSAEIYAHRIFQRIITKCDLLIDLHTASHGRVNSLYVRADMTHEATARMAYFQKPQIIVHNPASDYTLRGAAAAHDIPAITVEIGNPGRYHRDYIKRSTLGIRSVMSDLNMIRKRAFVPGEPPIVCQKSRWIFTENGGLLTVLPKVTERVKSGQCIAVLKNPFGDIIEEYTMPIDGIVIGHSIDPVALTGARILHYGEVADAADPTFHSHTILGASSDD